MWFAVLLAVTVLLAAGLAIMILRFSSLRKRLSQSRLSASIKERELLSLLINSMPDRIYFKDRESRFIIANRHVAEIMGANDPNLLIDKTDFEFYRPGLAKAYYDDEQRIMREGKPMIGKEEPGLDMDKNEITISTTKIPVKDNNGNVIGIVGIGRDITPQKEIEKELKIKSENLQESNVLLEERQEEIQQMAEELNAQSESLMEANKQLERLSLVASRTENVVVIMDGNANFLWVNKGFEDLYGYNLKEYIKRYGENLRDSSSNINISAILNQINITRKPYTYNSRSKDKEGAERWYQTNITPIMNQDDEIDYLILIDSDITDLKKAEEQIKEQKKEIETQRDELSTLNATKDRLFSIIAHDLKNPFHSIMGFTELMKSNIDEFNKEKLGEFIDLINISSASAYQLLQNLLEWARSQTDRIRINPGTFKVKEVAGEVINLQKLHAGNKNIQLVDDIPEELRVYADKNMLHTILRNLTSNAIKFTNEGGTITLAGQASGDNTIIKVTDTGIGIPRDKQTRLFQLDKVTSTAGTAGETGTGLGLIVCEEFVTKNNGSISIESQPGKGTTFILRFSASQA